MTEINSSLVEKYQLLLQNDPRAKVFAPLAEAYRKMGLLDEGIQVCLRGVEYHPNFPSGRVALGRLYLAKGSLAEAAEQLQLAVEQSPENLLAQSLLGETYVKLRRPKEALAAYKMLLFLNPNDEKAQSAVRKLETLTADEYEDDVFAMEKLGQAAESVGNVGIEKPESLSPLAATSTDLGRVSRDLLRFLSLADAFLVRNDFERAIQTLENAEKIHGPQPEIKRRQNILSQRFADDAEPMVEPPPPREMTQRQGKIALLQELKARIQAHRRNA